MQQPVLYSIIKTFKKQGVSELAKALSQQQFSEHITRCSGKLYRVAYCYVKNEQDALDIVSEATYKAYLSFERMKTPQYFESWLTRIVIHCALDRLNRNKRITFMEDQTQEYAAAELAVPLEEKLGEISSREGYAGDLRIDSWMSNAHPE